MSLCVYWLQMAEASVGISELSMLPSNICNSNELVWSILKQPSSSLVLFGSNHSLHLQVNSTVSYFCYTSALEKRLLLVTCQILRGGIKRAFFPLTCSLESCLIMWGCCNADNMLCVCVSFVLAQLNVMWPVMIRLLSECGHISFGVPNSNDQSYKGRHLCPVYL